MTTPTPESVTIVLPLPSRRLSPNCPVATRGSRMAKAAATKAYRQQAAYTAAHDGLESTPWAMARATLTFYWPDERRRDIRNAEHMMKAAYDGIVDAGIIEDDDHQHLAHGETRFEVDREWPRVEITIERMAR